MKRLLLLLIAISVLFACNSKLTSNGFEINKRVLYNRNCDFIIYSTNTEDFYTPNILYRPFSSNNENRILKMSADGNFYIRDSSCDCRHIILVGEKLRKGKYDLYLYDLESDITTNITEEIHADLGDPFFLNHDTILLLIEGTLYTYTISDKSWNNFFKDIKFEHLFKGDDQYVFLQDIHSSIWKLDFDQREITKMWEAPETFQASRKIKMHKSKIFFISDHETGFNNIYSLTIDNLLLEAKVTDRYDHFLANNSFFLQDTLTYIKNMGLYFLSNVDKAPRDGVIYDYMAKNDSLLLLYASPEKPASLYLVSDSGLVDILQQKVPTKNYDVVIESRENGVDNLLFLPNETKQWVVWLHGGPHEQVSYRFNPYIHHLASNNIGVIALNYPGSTGLGNKFEIRNISQKDRLEIQLEAIKQDLAIFVDKYGIDSFSLVGVSYGSILAHHLAGDRGFNVKKLVDFSGVNVSENLVGSNIEVMYIMGDLDFILSNPYRVSLLNEHKKKGAKTLILEEDGHSISRNKNISKTIDVMLNFLADY